MSFESAFSGETYTTSTRSSSSPASAFRISRSMATRNAASVLPDPVGAETSVSRPAKICGQPSAWASVGPLNRPSNQARVIG